MTQAALAVLITVVSVIGCAALISTAARIEDEMAEAQAAQAIKAQQDQEARDQAERTLRIQQRGDRREP